MSTVKRYLKSGLILSFTLISLPELSSNEIPGSGLRYPTQTSWNSLYLQLEEKLDNLPPSQAAEELTVLIKELEKIQKADGEAHTVPLTLPAGRGYALGATALVKRLKKLASSETLEKYVEYLSPYLDDKMETLPERAWDNERVQFRHQLLRDHEETDLAYSLAQEHIIERLEAGDLEAAGLACRVLEQHSKATSQDQLRARWIQFRIQKILLGAAKRTHGASKYETLKKQLQSSIENPADGIDPQLKELIQKEIDRPIHSNNPLNLQVQRWRHPLWLRTQVEPQLKGGYALGSVQHRQPFEFSELRSHLDRFVPRVNPHVAPLRDEQATEAPKAIANQRASNVSLIDIALPFFPVSDGKRIYLQTYKDLIALDSSSFEQAWKTSLKEETFEALGTLKSPAPIGNTVVCTTSEIAMGLLSETGEIVWKQRVAYSRKKQGLLLTPEEFSNVKGVIAVKDILRQLDAKDDPDLLSVSLTPAYPSPNSALIGARARVDGQTFVYCISYGVDGTPLWSTYLGSSEGSDHLGMSATISPPIAREGKVFLSTNSGFIACLDAYDGQILWLQAYPRLNEAGKVRAIDKKDRWQANPIYYHKGDLYLTPSDSDELFRIDAQTGRIVGRLPRLEQTTLLGSYEDRLILGGAFLRAIHIDEEKWGQLAWTWKPPSGYAIPQGRSYIENGEVLVSDLNALYSIDAQTGTELSTALWDFRGGGGNLLPLPSGHLVVASNGGYLIYNHRERERDRIRLLPPNSELRILATARLQLKSGDLKTGLITLNEWAKKRFPPPPNNSPTDRILFELSELLRYSIEIHGSENPLTPDILILLTRTERQIPNRAVAAFQAAKWYHQHQSPTQSIAVIRQALASRLGNIDCRVNEFLEIPGQVLATNILKSIQTGTVADQAAYQKFEYAAEEAFVRAKRIGSQDAFERIVRLFPTTLTAGKAQLELAQYFKAKQNQTAALGWLIDHLRDYPNSDRYSEVALDAVNLQTSLNRYQDARDLLLELAKKYPNKKMPKIGPRRTTETIEQFVKRRLKDPGFQDLTSLTEGRWLRFPVRPLWRSPANLLTTQRNFFNPKGEWPTWLKDAFFTHSKDLIECRNLDTGLPIWTFHWSLHSKLDVPKTIFSRRSDDVGATFFGDLLIFNDTFNVLAIDSQKGNLRWSITLKPEENIEDKDSPLGRGLRLRERIREVVTHTAGTFIRTSEDRIYCHSGDGSFRWKIDVDTSAGGLKKLKLRQNQPGVLRTGDLRNLYGPYVVNADEIAIYLDPSPGEIVYLSTRDGKELRRVTVGEKVHPALVTQPKFEEGRLLLLYPKKLQVLDVVNGETITQATADRHLFRDLWTFPSLPGHAVVSTLKTRGKLNLKSFSVSTGETLWEYDNLETRRNGTIALYVEDRNFYILHGDDKAKLAALKITSGPELGKFTALSQWPNEITLSHFLLFDDKPKLSLTYDSIIFHDLNHQSLSVYDKKTGRHRGAMLEPLNKFLADKPRFQFLTRNDLLVIATDRGDAAFEANLGRLDLEAKRERLDRLRTYLENPRDWKNVIWLALHFFKEENSSASLKMLNDALLSEHLPSLESPGMYTKLKYLLDGIKEEQIKYSKPEIISRKLRRPPTIDGRLDENWNFSHRVRLNNPQTVNLIPSPGQAPDLWKGEEDLSGTLYTGWNDEYFFFAFDVDDHQIFPYDKRESFWKGDCLVIGLDPTGDGGLYHRTDDQLLTLALTVPNRKKEDKDQNQGNQGDDPEEDPDEEEQKNKPKGQYAVKKKDDNSGVIYEVAIPWSTFEARFEQGEKPQRGKRFGLSLIVTDDDSGQGATKMLSINPCHLLPRDQTSRSIWKHLKPEFFPKVILE